jgi:hypothetical protein
MKDSDNIQQKKIEEVKVESVSMCNSCLFEIKDGIFICNDCKKNLCETHVKQHLNDKHNIIKLIK